MTDISLFQAIVLGIVQGLTEFLPVSSSAHLAIVQRRMGLDPDSPALLLFDVLTHLGTLAAVLIVFRREILRLAIAAVASPSTGAAQAAPRGTRISGTIFLLAVLACIPTAVIGLAFKEAFEAAFGKPKWIGASLLVTAALLTLTGLTPRPRRGWRQFSAWRAVLVGVAQAAAILPGISRSGATICTALMLGLRRRWAAQFSFLIAFPAILGASALKFKDTLELPSENLAALNWAPLIAGSLVSCAVGLAALVALLATVRKARLHLFAPYCLLLGLLILAGWL